VGQLTGGIAHDFNNLLMAISGNLQLLDRRLEPGLAARKYVTNAMAATDKGAKVTAQLLAFSRSQRLTIAPFAVEPIITSAVELIRSSLGPTIVIETDLRTQERWVLSDPHQLELALLNLAINARDAMPEGGRLRIESDSLRTRLSASTAVADYVSIRVADTGCGMSSEVLAKAIEPFFTTKPQGKGTGLGLSQVYGFLGQSRGELHIDSEPGRGTRIELLLPMTDPVAASAEVDAAAAEPDANQPDKRALLLVIDDDDGVRRIIVEALLDAGFDVIEAADGPSGLAHLDHSQPAAAVIDFLMPGMNGAEVARLAQKRQPGLPIVFVSGYSDTLAMEGIAGAVVLRKPFDVESLNRSVAAAIQ
jgi:CheY-like chemotaxis protein